MAPIDGCRSCGHPELLQVLDLGLSPIADRLIGADRLQEPEPRFPLEVVFCPECSLLQIRETVDPRILFCEDYPYYSSFSDELVRHSRANVVELIESRGLGGDGQVIELASNDGYLLRHYVEHGVPVLGIDPAEGPARAAEAAGVPTRNTFFTRELADQLVAEGLRADVIHANNVLAHVADTNGFVAGLAALVKADGVVVIEVPYVKDLIDHVEFDTIYHQHLCYFSVTALDRLFRRHGLYLNDVRRLAIHGGSLRLYLEPRERVGPAVTELLGQEQKAGLDRLDYYLDFAQQVERVKRELLNLLGRLKREGRRIAAYGAAAKGCTLINFVGIGPDLIDYVVDRNVHKHGRFMPGQRLPIFGTERLTEDQPEYCLLLAWNFASEIAAQQAAYQRRGGRFIVPVPTPRILGAAEEST